MIEENHKTMYNICVKRILIFVLVSLLLSSCSSKEQHEQGGLQSTLSTTSALTHQNLERVRAARPAPILGLHTTIFIAKHTVKPVQSALDGMMQQMELLSLASPQTANERDVFAVLERLGEMLRTDVTDLLNRSVHRAKTLDMYAKELLKSVEQASDHTMLLVTQLNDIKHQLRTKKKERRSAETALKNILKEQDFARVGPVKQSIASLEEQEAILDIHEDQLKDASDILENLIQQGNNRLNILEQNREFLIAGLRAPSAEEGQELHSPKATQNRQGSSD